MYYVEDLDQGEIKETTCTPDGLPLSYRVKTLFGPWPSQYEAEEFIRKWEIKESIIHQFRS